MPKKAESKGLFLLYSLLTGDSPQLACAAVPYTYLHSKTINAIRQGFGAVLPWFPPYQLYRNRQATRLFTEIGDLSLLIDLRSDISDLTSHSSSYLRTLKKLMMPRNYIGITTMVFPVLLSRPQRSLLRNGDHDRPRNVRCHIQGRDVLLLTVMHKQCILQGSC